MSDSSKQVLPNQRISRRKVFQTATAACLAASATATAAADDEKSEGLPSFKFDIENQKGWVGEAGSAKEATVTEFPVSRSIAGVSMRLKPGGLRELHWHSLAAEWAYMLEGRCRVTVISPNGQAEVSDFGPGDTWYFPRGHGHSLQGLGPEECHMLLGFDNGNFSEFGTFSVTDWMANTPPAILSRNLGVPVSMLAQLPKKEVYIGAGKVPPPIIEGLRNPDIQTSQSSHKYRLLEQPPRIFEGGREYIVSSKEFPIQTTMTAARLELQPGALREMHWHPHADEWQYYMRGRARVTIFGSHGRTRTEEFGPGQVSFIQQGYGHFIEQLGNDPLEILTLFNSGVFESISLSAWLGANPGYLLEDNFGVSKSVVDRMVKKESGILGRRA
jgi:oxalate decarboxylase